MSTPPPQESLRTLLRKALPFVTPDAGGLVLVLVLACAGAAMSAGEPLVLKSIFDALSPPDRNRIALRVGLFVGLLVAHEAVVAVLDWLVWRLRVALDYRLLRATIERLHALPIDFHGKHAVGALVTKVERGIAGTVGAFSAVAFNLLPSVVYLAMAIVVMLDLEWRLGLVILAFAPLPAIIGARASHEQVARERNLLERWTRVFSRFHEVLASIVVVKSFSMEDKERRTFLRQVRAANRVVVRGVATDATVNAAKNTVVVTARLAALALGAYYVASARMPIGTLVAFLGYVAGLFQPVQSLTGMYQTLRRGRVSLEAVFSILGAEDTVEDIPSARDAGSLRGAIAFRDVSFGYGNGPRVLDRVSLEVSPGQTIALVGPSGGGKTTLVRLMQRLYDPTLGAVEIDGTDVRAFKQRSLRGQIGVVLQEGALFGDSIRNNIAFGRPDATLAEVESAARAANADDFIARLPAGYDTVVGARGSTLSGGERQRIAIARALLKDAPILILDEATSALDAEAEAKVQEALGRLTFGRTTIVIAHRLATVVRADRILVLDGGRIVEDGTHDDLMRAGGMYATLVARQLSGLTRDAA